MGGVFSTNQKLDERIERALEIQQLKDEIVSLKQDNNILRHEMMRELRSRNNILPRSDNRQSEVSSVNINEFVEKLLNDPETNLGFVPDIIERPTQQRMLLFLLKSIAHTLDASSIKLPGHEIVFHMRPVISREEEEEVAVEPSFRQYDQYDSKDYEKDYLEEPGAIDEHNIPL